MDLALATMRRVSWRLLPFLFVLFVFNFIDRQNVGIAALQMNRDLRLSASAYGLGAGIFFLGYALFEVPSNLILARVGARRWIARIMISWGLVATAMMFVRTPLQFYVLRFVLGVAEAGFVPGIIYYLGHWFPTQYRGRAIARFMLAAPVAAATGNALGGWLLGFDGRLGLAGWQWLFLVEGAPSVLLGFSVLRLLTDRPEEAHWLTGDQRAWLAARLQRDEEESGAARGLPPLRALAHPMVLLVSLVFLLHGTTGYGFAFWAPTLIRETLHASNAATGLIAGSIAALAAITMLAVGASSDRTGERYLHATGCALLAALGYAGAALLPNPVARLATFALVAAGTISFAAPFWCIPIALLRGSAAAAGIAFVSSIGAIGGFVGPFVVGLLRDATGSTNGAFLGFAALGLVVALLCLVLRRYATSGAGAFLIGRSAAVSPQAGR